MARGPEQLLLVIRRLRLVLGLLQQRAGLHISNSSIMCEENLRTSIAELIFLHASLPGTCDYHLRLSWYIILTKFLFELPLLDILYGVCGFWTILLG